MWSAHATAVYFLHFLLQSEVGYFLAIVMMDKTPHVVHIGYRVLRQLFWKTDLKLWFFDNKSSCSSTAKGTNFKHRLDPSHRPQKSSRLPLTIRVKKKSQSQPKWDTFDIQDPGGRGGGGVIYGVTDVTLWRVLPQSSWRLYFWLLFCLIFTYSIMQIWKNNSAKK